MRRTSGSSPRAAGSAIELSVGIQCVDLSEDRLLARGRPERADEHGHLAGDPKGRHPAGLVVRGPGSFVLGAQRREGNDIVVGSNVLADVGVVDDGFDFCREPLEWAQRRSSHLRQQFGYSPFVFFSASQNRARQC